MSDAWRQHLVDDDARLAALLRSVRRIAVVGYKSAAYEAAHRIPAYMRAHGYEVVAVNPKVREAFGQPAYSTLAEVPGAIDLVNLFRAITNVPPHVDEILALPQPPRAVWMQLGIRHPRAAERLARAGIDVVQDRCLMIDHQRLAA